MKKQKFFFTPKNQKKSFLDGETAFDGKTYRAYLSCRKKKSALCTINEILNCEVIRAGFLLSFFRSLKLAPSFIIMGMFFAPP